MPDLKEINKNLKTYINEASGISDRCKNKLIKLVEKHFLVSLPHENFKNIDIEVLENGNIKMRDIEYATSKTPDENTILERYNNFCEEMDELLKKNETNFDKKKTTSNIINIFVLILYLIITIIVSQFALNQILAGNMRAVIYFGFIISYYIVPISGEKIRNRIKMAKRYIKSFLK